jgi:hypothetical protein
MVALHGSASKTTSVKSKAAAIYGSPPRGGRLERGATEMARSLHALQSDLAAPPTTDSDGGDQRAAAPGHADGLGDDGDDGASRLFNYYDRTGRGKLSLAEFGFAVRRDGCAALGGGGLSDAQIADIFHFVNTSGSGYVDEAEFHAFLARGAGPPPTASAKKPPRKKKRSRKQPAPRKPPEVLLHDREMELKILHCAEWVARHGVQFETVLRTRNLGILGWEFLTDPASDAAVIYRHALADERARLLG